MQGSSCTGRAFDAASARAGKGAVARKGGDDSALLCEKLILR